MRILFVAMADSIHTKKWISQLDSLGWDLHLFSSRDNGLVHKDLQNSTVYHSIYNVKEACDRSIKRRGIPIIGRRSAILGREVLKEFIPRYRVIQLKRVIRKIKPDIIHSLEFQHSGYLTLEAKQGMVENFPPWIVTNWGSDIYLYGRLPEHQDKIRKLLSSCDYYSCECQRDVRLAQTFGYRKRIFPVLPNTGGFDVKATAKLRSSEKASTRSLIMLKGYQNWSGRALVGLRALERCSDLLKSYRLVVYSAASDVILASKLFSESTGIPVTIVPKDTSNNEIQKLHGQARISIGLSISDAISTSLLETMALGSFPIQSWTACADEWIQDGENGLIVPPEDPEVVEGAIRKALTDDDLVDTAAKINYLLIEERLDRTMLSRKAQDMYNAIVSEKG